MPELPVPLLPLVEPEPIPEVPDPLCAPDPADPADPDEPVPELDVEPVDVPLRPVEPLVDPLRPVRGSSSAVPLALPLPIEPLPDPIELPLEPVCEPAEPAVVPLPEPVVPACASSSGRAFCAANELGTPIQAAAPIDASRTVHLIAFIVASVARTRCSMHRSRMRRSGCKARTFLADARNRRGGWRIPVRRRRDCRLL
jgi:hypothetical protein